MKCDIQIKMIEVTHFQHVIEDDGNSVVEQRFPENDDVKNLNKLGENERMNSRK